MNFQPILDCCIPKFKLKYDDLENIKTDRVNIVVFNLHEIKQLKVFFWDTQYSFILQLFRNEVTLKTLNLVPWIIYLLIADLRCITQF